MIGTHRVLSKDVEFKDLGLLIIDEEQRFGVTHKEKIKKMKENVDVLTLTATPIPRTLHMSLIGIRDMSVLEEAPMDRMPIQTYVMEYNDEMVREAIERELARDGQVYYVYNRVTGYCGCGRSGSSNWFRMQRSPLPMGRCRSMNWKVSCTILSMGRSMCWFPQRSSRPDWIFPM